jgi:dienelactone hydrolase
MLTTDQDIHERTVAIPIDGVILQADLSVPRGARGLVLFAHGSGSSRKSPRNRAVAEELQHGGLATLLLDLLTMREEREDSMTGQLRFDIAFLATRLESATDWVRNEPETRALPVGYFGASTGAAAALVAAANRHECVHAVVSRGGRPDLAGHALGKVRAPTLLIVGGFDEPVIDLNRDALASLHVEKQLEIVPRAGHLFEEPGALTHVAQLARRWFERHLVEHAHAGPAAGW